MTIEQTPTRPWFKQFWPWFLIVLPTTAVIASMLTISLAVSNAPILTTDSIGKFAREQIITRESQELHH